MAMEVIGNFLCCPSQCVPIPPHRMVRLVGAVSAGNLMWGEDGKKYRTYLGGSPLYPGFAPYTINRWTREVNPPGTPVVAPNDTQYLADEYTPDMAEEDALKLVQSYRLISDLEDSRPVVPAEYRPDQGTQSAYPYFDAVGNVAGIAPVAPPCFPDAYQDPNGWQPSRGAYHARHVPFGAIAGFARAEVKVLGRYCLKRAQKTGSAAEVIVSCADAGDDGVWTDWFPLDYTALTGNLHGTWDLSNVPQYLYDERFVIANCKC